MAKRSSQNPGSNRERKLNALRTELRSYLLPTVVPTDAVIREIERFLARWGDKPAIPRLVSNQLAKHFVSKWPFAGTKSVEPLIEAEIHALLTQSAITPAIAKHVAARLTTTWRFASNEALDRLIKDRPELLDQAVSASARDELDHLIKMWRGLPRSKRKRTKPSSDQERSQRQRKSKNRYESRRREYRDASIEEEFGRLLPNPFIPNSFVPSTGPCLDILFSGGDVRMAGCVNSLENLFGVDRHRFPKSLSPTRRGRNAVYDLVAFMECLIHLLKKRDGGTQWLPERRKRELVLAGIIERARRFSLELAGILAKKLRPYRS
jgi:hypothetical protein